MKNFHGQTGSKLHYRTKKWLTVAITKKRLTYQNCGQVVINPMQIVLAGHI